MTDSVIVCNGCCCGNTNKGHNAVPVDFLKTEWEKQGLAENVKLTISDCLGPCSMHNVTLLKTSEGHTWLGNLSENGHFEALIDWASGASLSGNYVDLPKILENKRFIRLENES